MCQLCNGTHVVHNDGSYYTLISACPECGPVPEGIQKERIKALRERINAKKEQNQ
jgi:hydrogenase maturation factor HypF (carbamoyltransferase family)